MSAQNLEDPHFASNSNGRYHTSHTFALFFLVRGIYPSTMKFTASVLAFIAATAHAAVPRMGAPNHEMLMKHAVPVDSSKTTSERNLFELSGDHSIQFQSCSTLTTEPYSSEIFYSQYNLQAAQAGQIKSERSYVIFNVCETGTCAYAGNDNVFMVDLKTFVRSTMPYSITKKTRYCSVCEVSQEYCE